MDDLLIIIIRALIRAFTTPKQNPLQRGFTYTPPTAPPTPVAPAQTSQQKLRKAIALNPSFRAAQRRREAGPAPRIARPVAPLPTPVPPPAEAPNIAAITTNNVRQNATNLAAGPLRAALTPGALRYQYVLTEILQPPVSLRQHRGNDL